MPNDARPGWYWECEADKSHWSSFAAATHVRIVRFFFELAQAGWPQDRLVFPCPKCGRPMRIAYDFPRGEQPEHLLVHHVVGLNDYVEDLGYLPMMWESRAESDTQPWFDAKYVRRLSTGAYSARGLLRPAVFSRSDLVQLFQTYKSIVGNDLLA